MTSVQISIQVGRRYWGGAKIAPILTHVLECEVTSCLKTIKKNCVALSIKKIVMSDCTRVQSTVFKETTSD